MAMRLASRVWLGHDGSTMTHRISPRLAAALSITAAMVLTGSNVPFGKAIVGEIPIYLFLPLRFAVACLALAPLAARESGPRLSQTTPGQRRDIFAMSLLGMVGYTIFILEGLKRTSASDAGIITATIPAVVALMGVAFAGDRLSRRQMAAVGLAVAGLALIQGFAAGTGARTLAGNLLVGGAVLCEASFVVLGKRLAPPFRPFRLSLGANLVGLVLSIPLVAIDARGFDPSSVQWATWVLSVWYALSASVICLWLWYRGLPYVETWMAGLATAAIPVSALLVSALYLREAIGWPQLAGAALVIAAIVVGARSAQRTPPPG